MEVCCRIRKEQAVNLTIFETYDCLFLGWYIKKPLSWVLTDKRNNCHIFLELFFLFYIYRIAHILQNNVRYGTPKICFMVMEHIKSCRIIKYNWMHFFLRDVCEKLLFLKIQLCGLCSWLVHISHFKIKIFSKRHINKIII